MEKGISSITHPNQSLILSEILDYQKILKDGVGGQKFAWVEWVNHTKPEDNFGDDRVKSLHIELNKFKIENAASLAQECLS